MATFKYTNADNSIIQKTNDDGSVYAVHNSNTILWDELVAEANGSIQAYVAPPERPANPSIQEKITLAGFEPGELEGYIASIIAANESASS